MCVAGEHYVRWRCLRFATLAVRGGLLVFEDRAVRGNLLLCAGEAD
jgi:hypothetical protein